MHSHAERGNETHAAPHLAEAPAAFYPTRLVTGVRGVNLSPGAPAPMP